MRNHVVLSTAKAVVYLLMFIDKKIPLTGEREWSWVVGSGEVTMQSVHLQWAGRRVSSVVTVSVLQSVGPRTTSRWNHSEIFLGLQIICSVGLFAVVLREGGRGLYGDLIWVVCCSLQVLSTSGCSVWLKCC